MPLLRGSRSSVSAAHSLDAPAGPQRSSSSADSATAAAMLVMQLPSQPLEPGSRRLKKGEGKDKLKNRMSMAFKKPFSLSKSKWSEPIAPPASQPPAYSAAQPVSLPNRPRTAPAPSAEQQRHSGGVCGSTYKPTHVAGDGPVPRRSYVGADAVGASPPLPPLPRKDSVEPTDPRVTALLGADLSAQINPLLPRNSFGPSFETSMDGLGIGVEHGAGSPPSPARTPLRIATPPHVEIRPLAIRRHSPSPPQQPPMVQLSLPLSLQSVPHPPQQHALPPLLARPVTAPEGVHLLRRKSMLRSDGEPSEASKRLSMMRRGPPVLTSDDSSPRNSVSSHETASPVPVKTPPPIAREPESITSPVGTVAALKVAESDALLTSRDRIALLRGGRASVSAAAGDPLAGPAGRPGALRGVNRKDATKSYTVGAAPVGFDVSLVAPQRSTFTPLKPLHLPAAQAARPSPLTQRAGPATSKLQPAPPAPAPPSRSNELYCRRPMVSMSTQTPREWTTPAAPPRTAPRQPVWMQAVSTPPQAYGAFSAPTAVPPPVPPHDTPPQKHTISPSIYSVASFDPRTGRSAHRRNRSDCTGFGFDEEAEFAFADVDGPLPAEAVAVVQRYRQALPQVSAGTERAVASPAINYDLPYLSPMPYDDSSSMYRSFGVLSTPLAQPLVQEAALVASEPMRNLAVSSPTGAAEDRTPTITPVQRSTLAFEPSSPPSYAADAAAQVSMRPRSTSPVPALSQGHSSAEDEEDLVSSQTSSIRRAGSSLSSARRSSVGEPLTPPTSAVSSVFPGQVGGVDYASGDEADEPVVTIRKASLVTSQVRKASLVTPPTSTSRPPSMVASHVRVGSISSTDPRRRSSASSVSASGSTSGVERAPSPRSPGSAAGFYLELPSADEVPPVPAVPSPIRREYGEAAFPFPVDAPAPAVPAALASPKPVAPSPRLDAAEEHDPATPAVGALALQQDRARPAPARARPAPAPPEDSASLPLRRQSESDTPLVRARPVGSTTLSRAERAARGRSYFLVQALMGESQPEGMIRDWARGDDEGSDDESLMGGESSGESEFSEEE